MTDVEFMKMLAGAFTHEDQERMLSIVEKLKKFDKYAAALRVYADRKNWSIDDNWRSENGWQTAEEALK